MLYNRSKSKKWAATASRDDFKKLKVRFRRLRLAEECREIFFKKYLLGALTWRTLRSQIRCSESWFDLQWNG